MYPTIIGRERYMPIEVANFAIVFGNDICDVVGTAKVQVANPVQLLVGGRAYKRQGVGPHPDLRVGGVSAGRQDSDGMHEGRRVEGGAKRHADGERETGVSDSRIDGERRGEVVEVPCPVQSVPGGRGYQGSGEQCSTGAAFVQHYGLGILI